MMSDIKMNFNTEVAKDVGTDAAIILSNIEFWEATNRANKRNYYNGRYWTYNSAKAFADIFNYLSPHQIRRMLDKLEENGYIISGSFNKKGYDRTKWYSPTRKISQNRKMQLTESQNAIDGIAKPIPNDKPNNKVLNNKNILLEKFWDAYDKRVGKIAFRKAWMQLSEEDMNKAIDFVPKYKAAREKVYMKDPVRFIRNRAWEDELIVKEDKKPKKKGNALYNPEGNPYEGQY
tara:strand:+ start:73 stop:771 length:699 start_codon:yes stop_codon:yes gene_type:complete